MHLNAHRGCAEVINRPFKPSLSKAPPGGRAGQIAQRIMRFPRLLRIIFFERL